MIKHRLALKGKIVGYEDHKLYENGFMYIYHKKNEKETWINVNDYRDKDIPHDDKDRYVCNDKDGNEIYENDYMKGECGELYLIVWNEEDLKFDCLVYFDKGEFEWDGNIGDNIHPKDLFVFRNAHENKIIADPEKEGYWKIVKNDNPGQLEEK